MDGLIGMSCGLFVTFSHQFVLTCGAAEATDLVVVFFFSLLSTLVCCQPTELIWAFLFHKFSISGFCSPCCIFHTYEQMILCVFDCISLLLFMIFYILPPPVNFAAPP